MASHKPLVMIGGSLRQLPPGDTVEGATGGSGGLSGPVNTVTLIKQPSTPAVSSGAGVLYVQEAPGAYPGTPVTPYMTGATTPSGVVSASSNYPTAPPYLAFADSGNGWISSGVAGPHWIKYEFPTPQTVTAYGLWPWDADTFPQRCPTAFQLQGSNNDTDWTDVDTRTGISNWAVATVKSFTCTTAGAYKYYRLYITANGGNAYTGVRRIFLYTNKPFLWLLQDDGNPFVVGDMVAAGAPPPEVIRTPIPVSPLTGTAGVSRSPVLTTKRYGHLYGVPQDTAQWQVSTSSTFATLAYDSGSSADIDPFSGDTVFSLGIAGVSGSTAIVDATGIQALTLGGGAVVSDTHLADGGMSVSLDGAGDYISMPSTSFSGYSGDLTIEVEFRLRSLPSGDTYNTAFYLFGYGPNSSDTGLDFFVGLTKIKFGPTSYASPIISADWAPALGVRYRLALVRMGSQWWLYLDGVLCATASSTSALCTHSGTAQIGGCEAQAGGVNTGWFNGWLFKYRIVKAAKYIASVPVPTKVYPSGSPSGLSMLLAGGGTNGPTVVTDSGPNAIVWSPNGGVTISTAQPGVSGSSILFNGSNGYLSTGGNSALDPGSGAFLWECMIYRNSVTDAGYSDAIWYPTNGPASMAVSIDPSGRVGISASSDGANWNIRRGSDNGDPKGSHTLSLGQWHHLAVCRIGSFWAGFTNGELDQFFVSSASVSNSTGGFRIGRCHDGWSRYFNGYIQMVRYVKGNAVFQPVMDAATAQFKPLKPSGVSHTVLATLAASTLHYWRVRHIDVEEAISSWSPTQSFTTDT